MSDLFKEVFGNFEKVLNRTLDNQNINITIKILLGLYAALAAPKLPPSLANLIDNTFSRIGFAFIIVYMATRDPGIAILVAVGFIITLQTANKMRLYNTNLSVSQPGQTSWLPSAKNYVESEDNMIDEENVNNLENNVNGYNDNNNNGIIDNMYETSSDLVGDVINTGQNLAINAIDTGTELTSNIYNTSSDLLGNVINTGEELMEDVVETGSDLLDDIADTGSNLLNNVSDIGGSLLPIDDQSTANVSTPSKQLNNVVEGWDGIYPSSIKNAVNVDDQNNFVPGSNQYSCTRTFNNQHCIQGLEVNAPNGGEYSNFTEL